ALLDLYLFERRGFSGAFVLYPSPVLERGWVWQFITRLWLFAGAAIMSTTHLSMSRSSRPISRNPTRPVKKLSAETLKLHLAA
ncbi:hypothetical protein RA272_29580, partial [Pseudomonas syringae pv. tagetis]|uniref:hypothetical protein n=1 Tax=Pseudomonas syringae group genomosp. 7 TaxID=251699 RepID=UPI00376FD5FE